MFLQIMSANQSIKTLQDSTQPATTLESSDLSHEYANAQHKLHDSV